MQNQYGMDRMKLFKQLVGKKEASKNILHNAGGRSSDMNMSSTNRQHEDVSLDAPGVSTGD